MKKEEKDENNKKLAYWLGWRGFIQSAGVQFKVGCWLGIPPSPKHGPYVLIPDFFADESASALILEKMSAVNAYVWLEWDINEWCVSWLPTTNEDQEPPTEYNNRDRKTAIAEAALRLIDTPSVISSCST